MWKVLKLGLILVKRLHICLYVYGYDAENALEQGPQDKRRLRRSTDVKWWMRFSQSSSQYHTPR
jgi:hypothetical protein